ncbi:MAG TPA: STAS domain-containing protein [Pseudonocardiaceae bacterium]|jgi:anti-anti-sigma factor|nr:STAS domain-containing protein [Pseudonocardiaceae bacterium]
MLELHSERDGDVVVLSASGDVDLHTAGQLRDAVVSAVGSEDGGAPRQVDVDLAGVPFLNSSGLGALLAGVKEANRLGIVFRVLNLQPPVRRVVEMMGLVEVLDVRG